MMSRKEKIPSRWLVHLLFSAQLMRTQMVFGVDHLHNVKVVCFSSINNSYRTQTSISASFGAGELRGWMVFPTGVEELCLLLV